MRHALIAAIALGVVGAAGTALHAQSAAPSSAAPTAADTERAALPHPVLMTALDEALGDKASDTLRLTRTQSSDIAALHKAFESQVRDFVKKHAADVKSGANVSGDAEIPDREAVERKVLERLRPDQRAAVESRLRDAAAKRVEHHQHSGGNTSAQSSTSSGSSGSHDAHSSHSGQSSSQSNSQSSSSSDHKESSSHQSDHKSGSDKKSDSRSSNDSKSDHKSAHDSKSASDSQKSVKTWSSLDTDRRKAVLHSLLNQLSSKDRETLAKEAGLAEAPSDAKK